MGLASNTLTDWNSARFIVACAQLDAHEKAASAKAAAEAEAAATAMQQERELATSKEEGLCQKERQELEETWLSKKASIISTRQVASIHWTLPMLMLVAMPGTDMYGFLQLVIGGCNTPPPPPPHTTF